MAIRKIPQDTDTYHFHNENPRGRRTGDCAYRAVSTAVGISWNEAVRGLAEKAIETGYSPDSGECINKFLDGYGFSKMKQPRKADGKKYTGAELCEWLTKHDTGGKFGAMLISIGTYHVACIAPIADEACKGKIKYKIHDIWDSSTDCVGNIWVKCYPSLFSALYQD